MFKKINSAQYTAAYDHALGFLKNLKGIPKGLDLPDVAHELAEAILADDRADLKSLLNLFIKKSCILGQGVLVSKNVNNINASSDEISKVEQALDLGRLYLESNAELSQPEKLLFLKIWSAESLTDDEFVLIEALGAKVRKILYVKNGAQRLYFKSSCNGQGQIRYWQGRRQACPPSPQSSSH